MRGLDPRIHLFQEMMDCRVEPGNDGNLLIVSENGQSVRPFSGMIGAMSPALDLDHDACYRAIKSRDARFDGRLFIGVKTTGIYCRPICPARTPKQSSCTFFASAAAAQEAGFRSCLRCRPECSPQLAIWRGTSNTVSRGLALIADGALDGEDASVDTLATRLGVGERQLRRLFQQHLGASPITVAQTRRVLFAKQLIAETAMPLSQIALAAGFGSIRRFNAVFQNLYHRPPSQLRRGGGETGSALTLTLPFAPPYDWSAMLAELAERGEQIADGVWRRSFAIGSAHGGVEVRLHPAHASVLSATIRFPDVAALPQIVRRIRRVFDLSADPLVIGAQLSEDPLLAPLVRARPGLRVPGGWDESHSTRFALETSDAHDLFDASDPQLADAIGQLTGQKPSPRDLAKCAERWRPWRAYAAAHLLLASTPRKSRRHPRLVTRSLTVEGSTAHAR
jgi:AraC family transcriptional regulator, regulatory protein of adaptative response / DNA-3-methyladenine glycosylase II